MKPRRNRTVAALLLTLIAVAVPCVAWYVTGSRGLERRAKAENAALQAKATRKGISLAERLATRLEVLREAESARPFYHYQNLFHDPKGAAEGIAVSISPLAQGPADALIEAHFQVDDAGVLTLPTLNDEFPDLGLHSQQGAQCDLFGQLKDITFFCTVESAAATLTYRPHDVVVGVGGPAAAQTKEATVEVIDARAWRQHLEANALYADLKYGKKLLGRGVPYRVDEERVEIKVGPLVWYTLPVGDRAGLVALRGLETPAGVWTQGFVVSSETVARYLETSYFPARFQPALAEGSELPPGEVHFEVTGTPWEVVLDISNSLRETMFEASNERERFLRVFLIGALAAAIAGLLVVAMLYQSERLSQQRARFAASAAHELRTPLAGLRLYGEMLGEGLGDPTRARDYARRMAGEVERLGRVVTNVLSFTRLERESISVSPQLGDISAAVTAIVRRLTPALEASGAELCLDIESESLEVVFDRDALGHILQNLLDNAEKYTREVDDRRIFVRLKSAADVVELSVSDNGHGVPKELQRKLFRPFVRGHHPDAPEGLGLGLVLVKELVKAQGGDIRYDDAPGGGAVFTVTFSA